MADIQEPKAKLQKPTKAALEAIKKNGVLQKIGELARFAGNRVGDLPLFMYEVGEMKVFSDPAGDFIEVQIDETTPLCYDSNRQFCAPDKDWFKPILDEHEKKGVAALAAKDKR